MRNREKLRRLRATAVLTAAGLAVLLAAAGLAAAALTAVSRSFDVARGETRGGLATCAPGRTAVSGGFYAPLTEQGPAMVALDSTRYSARQWRLRARNLGGNGTATAYVYCDSSDAGLVTRSAQFTVSGGGKRGAGSAQCQPGEEAVAGGFDSPEANTYLMVSKRADVRTWRVAVYNPGAAPHQYTAFVYCDPSEPGLTPRARTITTSDTQRFGQSVIAPCKQTEELRSGGFYVEFSRAVDELDTDDIGIVHGSRRSGERSWQAIAFAVIGHPKLSAFAYCA
ncbi:MAG: hypothetical protein AABM66_11235 [Actinomycetota bacterium]